MKKKMMCASVLVVFLVISLFYIYGSSAATTTISASVDNNPTSIGQTFIMSINVVGAQNLWGWNVNVTWNPAVVNATKDAKGPFLGSNGDSDSFMGGTIDNVNGVIKGGPSQVLLTSGSVSGDGVLGKITFVVVGSGSANINLGNIRILDPTVPTHADEVFTQGAPLTITISSSTPTPTPTTSPTTNPTPTPTPSSGSSLHVSTDHKRYAPGDLVQVYANVTYNNAPVSSKDVAFTIRMQNNTDLATLVSRTDTTGIANLNFRLPKPEPNVQSVFGDWSILASAAVADANMTNTAVFSVGYSIIIANISAPSSVQRLGTVPITVTIQNGGNAPPGLTLVVSILDSAQVPLGTTTVSISTQALGSSNVTVSLPIPAWAYTGQATIYVNELTLAADQGGVPYCPQGTSQFQIV